MAACRLRRRTRRCGISATAIDVLVATTVIEVGIDVPNATVMLIEHPERFGLSQLHQLRGRVGRGAEQSYCILLGSYGDDSAERLRAVRPRTTGSRLRAPICGCGGWETSSASSRVARQCFESLTSYATNSCCFTHAMLRTGCSVTIRNCGRSRTHHCDARSVSVSRGLSSCSGWADRQGEERRRRILSSSSFRRATRSRNCWISRSFSAAV
jgi:superfamily II DNA or RNA helicase